MQAGTCDSIFLLSSGANPISFVCTSAKCNYFLLAEASTAKAFHATGLPYCLRTAVHSPGRIKFQLFETVSHTPACMHKQVLVPGNFTNHTMSLSPDEAFVKLGFCIGEHVMLKRRITVKTGPKLNDRKDINAGTKASIKGYVGTDALVVIFELPSGSKTKGGLSLDWKVKLNNLYLASEAPKPDPEEKCVITKKGFGFLGDPPVEKIYEEWEDDLMANDESTPAASIRTTTAFTLDSVVQMLPTYGAKRSLHCKTKIGD